MAVRSRYVAYQKRMIERIKKKTAEGARGRKTSVLGRMQHIKKGVKKNGR